MSYRVRLVIGILAVIAPILVMMTMNRMSIIRSFIYERELNRLNSIGQLVAAEVEKDLARGAHDEIAEVLALAALHSSVVRVNVLDSTRRIVYSTYSGCRGQQSLYEDTENLANLRDETYVQSFILNSPEGYHSLQLYYSLAKTHRDFAIDFRWAIVFGLLVFGAAATMAWLVSGYMERPVREATLAAQRIAKGDFDISLKPKTKDAYGRLVEALGQMAVDLREKTHAMRKKIDDATVELREKNRRLEELDRLKSELVAMVSHELRTPLTSIIGFARTLERIPMSDEKRQECLSIIQKEGKHLSFLIEDYLDVSKIETGNFSLTRTMVNIGDVIRGVVEAFPSKGNVRQHSCEGLPGVYADGPRLRRVFRNILENAVRHGGADVVIDIRISEKDGAVEVSISDNGPGIPPDVQERIFDKFFSADTEGNGSGLGLTIVKAIVEAHGGNVKCESEQGRGTTFFIRLPLTRPAENEG